MPRPLPRWLAKLVGTYRVMAAESIAEMTIFFMAEMLILREGHLCRGDRNLPG